MVFGDFKMEGGVWRTYYPPLILSLLIQGVRADGGLTGLIVAGSILGALVIILVVTVSLIYVYRSSRNNQKKRPPKSISNGDVHHMPNGVGPVPKGIPLQQKTSLPPPSVLNGTVGRGRPPVPRPYSVMGGPIPMPGTFRGPPPVFVGTFNRHGRPFGRPLMHHPYFFPPPYPQQVIYVDESEESDESEDSGRSTVREHKKRYHRSFLDKREASSVVIRELNETAPGDVQKENDSHRKKSNTQSRSKSKSPVRSGEQSKSRSRSQTPTPLNREEIRVSTRRTSDTEPFRKEQTFNFTPVEGDITFKPIGSRRDSSPKPVVSRSRRDSSPPPDISRSYRDPSPQREFSQREPSPTPEPSQPPVQPAYDPTDYSYASAIRPPENPLSVTSKSSWGDPDQDLVQNRTAPDNPLRMSMSERMRGIVEDGWGGKPSEFDRADRETFEYPPRTTEFSKSQKINEEDDHVYAVSLRQSRKSERPSTPPNDIPVTPRSSYLQETEPNVDYDGERRPATPPFDAYDLTPKPSFREKPTEDLGRTAQPETSDAQRSAFTNQVLQELKLRQRPNAADDSESRQDHAVNFSRQPDEIIPRSEPNSPRASMNMPQHAVPPPPPPGGIPVPPPPPPIPKSN